MRDLVVKYLSKGVSRRNFVTGLTKAGLTMTAAQSSRASRARSSSGGITRSSSIRSCPTVSRSRRAAVVS